MGENTLSERLSLVLREHNIKKKDFAASLGISANYVSLLLSGKRTGLSITLASLIEEKYGYAADWVLHGMGNGGKNELDSLKTEIQLLTDGMTLGEVKAVVALVRSMKQIKDQRRPPV